MAIKVKKIDRTIFLLKFVLTFKSDESVTKCYVVKVFQILMKFS